MAENEDILSQDEVSALLDAVNTGELDPVLDRATPEKPAVQQRRYKKYDFSGPGIISKDHTRAMNMLHQQFVRPFSSSLSNLLRVLVEIECDTVEQLTYSDFVMSLSDPSCLCKLSIQPLRGGAVIEISPDLVFPIIEKLLGGKAHGTSLSRAMTEIEKEIMRQMVHVMIRDLGATWQRAKKDIRFELETIETESDYVQIVSPNDSVMLVVMSVKFPPVTGMISICYPFSTIEIALSEARDNWLLSSSSDSSARDQESRPRVQQNLDKTLVPLRAVFPGTKAPVRELVKLAVGHVLELDVRVENRHILDPVVIEVGRKAKFLGRWGKSGKRRAVKIIGVIDDENVNLGS